MSVIENSPYDLYANYSTAATYASSVSTYSTESTDTESDSFTDLLTAETENADTDSIVDADLDTEDTDTDTDSDADTEDDSVGGTTANDSYYRPSTEVEDTPSDELSFMDMLQLMLLQFQNQTIDDTASTTEMMNQLVQMTTMQAMTSMEASITEMTATNAMLYNAQLVGQEVTVAYYDDQGNFVEETGIVAASGYYDGVPVIFFEGQTSFHAVSSIMAIGKIPEGASTDDDGEDDLTVDPDGGDADLDVETEEDTDVTPEADVTPDTETSTGTDTEDVDYTVVDPLTVTYSNLDYSNMTADELLEAAANALG